MSEERRLERQLLTVRRLTGELRFELLLLERMRVRHPKIGGPTEVADRVQRCESVSDVYAAAVLRQGERRSST